VGWGVIKLSSILLFLLEKNSKVLMITKINKCYVTNDPINKYLYYVTNEPVADIIND